MRRLAAGAVTLVLSIALTTALPDHSDARGSALATSTCTSAELYASGYWLGATGSLAGPVYLANLGHRTCALAGYPKVQLIDQNGRRLDVRLEDVDARMMVPAIKHPPAVTLPPQQQQGTQVTIQWLSWCGPSPGSLSLWLTLPGVGHLVVHPLSSVLTFLGAARCDDHRRHSTLLTSPVEPNPSLGRVTVIPVGVPMRTASQLNVHGGRQGGGFVGVALGTIVLTDTSSHACVLSGIPSVTLLTAMGMALAIATVPPVSQADSTAFLEPGASATLDVEWSNWCGAPPGPLDVEITPAGGRASERGPFNGPPSYDLVPVCRDATQASTLTVSSSYHTMNQ